MRNQGARRFCVELRVAESRLGRSRKILRCGAAGTDMLQRDLLGDIEQDAFNQVAGMDGICSFGHDGDAV